MQQMPPIIIVFVRPIKPARVPAAKLPKGVIPIKETTKKLITRPRILSSTRVWSRVLLDAAWIIKPRPVRYIINKDNQKSVEKERPTRPVPNRPVAIRMILSKPNADFREARKMAPVRAPAPIDDNKNPRV